MSDTNDTVDGLLAEFRGYSAGMPPGYHVTMSWHDFRVMLNRLEAAHRRELAASGNAAKLREAIDKCVNLITEFGNAEIVKTPLDVIIDIEAILKAALAAPPRNCDRPECATTKAAQDVWRKEDGGKTAYYEWLLAPATEQEGGEK